jgi:hypothetical protein
MTRDDDLARVSREVAARLAALGIALDGHEDADELTELEEAVERFEEAVESRGGDLMVDEPPEGHRGQPDDPHFALPRRLDHESIARYLERLSHATDVVLRHPARD